MKHIKIYEEYSDEELRDLLGDMRSVGQSRVNLDIDYGRFFRMGLNDKGEESGPADNWSFRTPEGEEIRVKSGSLKFSAYDRAIVILNMTNGDVIKMREEAPPFDPSFYVNEKTIDVPDDIVQYPYVLATLKRYENYLNTKHKQAKK